MSGNLGHDSGKCFCPRFNSNMCPAGVLSALASWGGGGGIQSANTLHLANGEAGGLCCGAVPPPRAWAWVWGQGTTAFKRLSHRPRSRCQRVVKMGSQTHSMQSARPLQQDGVGGSQRGVRSNRAQDGRKVQAGQGGDPRPALPTSHFGRYRKSFLKSHFCNTAARLNSLLLPHFA